MDRKYFPTGACRLESEDGEKRRPARIGDALGEVVVLDHVGRVQVFVIDRIVRPHQGERRLMVKILPLALQLLMRLGKQRYRLAPTMAALLSSGPPTLRCFQRALGFPAPAGIEDARPIRKGGERLSAKVYAGLLSRLRQRRYRHVGAGEADIPAISVPADSDGLGRALQRTRSANCKTANLGENQEAFVQSSAAMLSDLGIGETIVAVTSMKTGIARRLPFTHTAEERLKRAVHAQHHVLQELAMNLAIVRHDLLDAGKLGLLLVVGDGHATLPPGFAPRFDNGVADLTAQH
jgi:hypothetical protein